KEDNGTVLEFHTVKAQVGNTKENVSGVNNNGFNLVRARDVLNMLGIEVGWNAERKRVMADGKLLDIHTEIYNGSAYCYVRDIAREVNREIEWDAENKTVKIGGEIDEL
ncbi:MAG: hypothetical protein IJ583_11070, partial [Firmicutes bacterium]|nr:hypothetical protein [Bacillota bacterium]